MSTAGGSQTRLELKAKAAEVDLKEIRAWVWAHPAGFVTAYPSRWVNNIYFDTPTLASFAENLSGQSARRKLRLRWYGTDDRKAVCVIEAKCKRAGTGWKISSPLSEPLDLADLSWLDITNAMRPLLETEFDIWAGQALTPFILNRYRREYFATLDGRVRVTLDGRQRLHDQRFGRVPNLALEQPRTGVAIVEFKANTEDSQRLADITQSFPIRLEKWSKYVDGVSRLLAI